MNWSDYWNALGSRQRLGVGMGAALIVIGAIAAAVWALRDPYVALASGLSADRLGAIAGELERAEIDYRIGEGSDVIAVPESHLVKARVAAAAGELGVPPSVGLELFKETDFSTTDFAQKINYQRALQGELTRTIETMARVRSARVHVILADSGMFKRNSRGASAAVIVALQPGMQLSRAQVRGIQRLVAASVPEIKVDDVVVLDESGASLTRPSAESEGDLSAAQLDLKRQADQYLESKLTRLLEEIAPQGTTSLSVDTTLDYRQLRVTTEEPIAARGKDDDGRAVGVLVKERQSQRSRPVPSLQAADFGEDYAAGPQSTDREYEYKVGHRMEQTLSSPGSIMRVSVAVVLQGAPAGLVADAVEQLVAHAIGIDNARGDSVAVLLLPAAQSGVEVPVEAERASTQVERPAAAEARQSPSSPLADALMSGWTGLALAALLLLAFVLWGARARLQRAPAEPVDVDAVAAKVRQWLSEGAGSDRA